MRKSLGFTLAEVLITLAIIGVVAAMTIPSVIINTNQQEYKTGLKKAVSVLNQAITMNMALENLTPTDITVDTQNVHNPNTLMGYLASRLNVIKSTDALDFGGKNAAFYTSGGMRFEFPAAGSIGGMAYKRITCGKGEPNNQGITNQPCMVVVDVNGDRRPNPVSPTSTAAYSKPDPAGTRINDVFSIMITDTAAIPYGTVAQRTMFQADDR